MNIIFGRWTQIVIPLQRKKILIARYTYSRTYSHAFYILLFFVGFCLQSRNFMPLSPLSFCYWWRPHIYLHSCVSRMLAYTQFEIAGSSFYNVSYPTCMDCPVSTVQKTLCSFPAFSPLLILLLHWLHEFGAQINGCKKEIKNKKGTPKKKTCVSLTRVQALGCLPCVGFGLVMFCFVLVFFVPNVITCPLSSLLLLVHSVTLNSLVESFLSLFKKKNTQKN